MSAASLGAYAYGISRYGMSPRAGNMDAIVAGSASVIPLLINKVHLLPDSSLMEAYGVLINNKELRCIPVFDGERIGGVINRQRFLENQMLGKCGYGTSLNHRKRVRDLMEAQFLRVKWNILIYQNLRALIQHGDFL
ncbi:MAG: hypothetical protein HQL01_00840 [Nitrospirae bacterium]|nr:hypothetical protein [Nitrospirota bacterium]